MKWIYAATLLMLIILLGFIWILYTKLTALDEQLENTPTRAQVEEQIDKIKRSHNIHLSDANKAWTGIWDRLDALESGEREKRYRGPQTVDILLVDLVRWILLKKDAALVPDDEAKAKERIEEIVKALEDKHLQGDEVIGPLMDTIRMNRDHYTREYLIRDVAWRIGKDAVPGLMEIFRDRKVPNNLRSLAAPSALKAGGNEVELLAEFTSHLGDRDEELAVRTTLVMNIFREYRHEGAVDLLIDGARNQVYPTQHRIACLTALALYDHPKVLRALEEIIYNADDDAYVINLAIQAYHSVLKEEALPFFRKILEEKKVNPDLRAKLKNILGKYDPEKKAPSSEEGA